MIHFLTEIFDIVAYLWMVFFKPPRNWNLFEGTSRESTSYTSGSVQGGGVLIIGQEQDSVAGSFDSTQAYR